MPEWIEGYKVVRRQGNRYVSVFEGRSKGYGFKVYGIGHVTKRTEGYLKGVKTRLRSYGPLGVFAYENGAVRFMERTWLIDDPCVVLSKCRYIKSADNCCWRPGYENRQLCHDHWYDERFADAVELVEDVK